MIEYVAGLLYNDDGSTVTLILKDRPLWQAGHYNAVGGKIEFGETPAAAMNREFIEEAGVDITWDFRFVLTGVDYKVHFFSCHSTEAQRSLRTMTSEVIEVVNSYDLPENTIPNLWWIIPMLNDMTIVQQEILVAEG